MLVAVAEHGGVVRAAGVLHQSPSSVSHTLTTLETKLGVRLFHRMPRGMVVTDVGRAMLGPARRALQAAAAAEAAAMAVKGLVAGRVTIVPARIFVSPVVDLVARFHHLHPQVLLSMLAPEGEHLIAEIVRSGECELGVMRSDLVPPDLMETPIGIQTGSVVMAADHPLAGGSSVRIEQLEGVDMIAPPFSSPFRPYFDQVLTEGGATPRIVAETEHLETTLELVCRGVGVSFAPVESAALVVGARAVVLPIDPPVSREMSLVAQSGDPLAPAAAAFWEFAASEFGTPSVVDAADESGQ